MEITIEWKPIATAPKEPRDNGVSWGRDVLLACYGGREPFVCAGWWRPKDEKFGRDEGWVSQLDHGVPTPYLEPRFWAEIPDAPPAE